MTKLEMLKKRQAIAKRTLDKWESLAPIRKAIVEFLETDGRELQICDLKDSIPELESLSTQEISAILAKLVIDGDIDFIP